jgi:hypothetical protein
MSALLLLLDCQRHVHGAPYSIARAAFKALAILIFPERAPRMLVSKNTAEAGAGPAAFQTANTDLKEKLQPATSD